MAADPSPLLEVGRITKPHGLRGEVLVSLTTTESSRVAPGATLRAGDRDLVVRHSTPHHQRWIVTFEGVDTREAAEALGGTVVRAVAKAGADDGEPDALWVHQMIGATVVDVSGRDHGQVVAVLGNPASDLLELESGALVPLRFVVGGLEPGPDGPTLRVDPPTGLLPD
ncbi:MAG TPA: ribosome maturation factor RimM [Acidimicrobiales bacterium]